MNGYSATITEASKELSPLEKVAFKDLGDTKPLGELKPDDEIIIEPDVYLTLSIHNEKSENKDYPVFIIKDKKGTRYSTSSENFWNTFVDIMQEVKGIEGIKIKVFTKPSKNYKGKYFLTCALVF